MAEQFITFACGADSLVGILHVPDRHASDVGILVVVGGPQYRVGAHRQFTLMARRFAKAGYAVLRFDYRGMGDSEGTRRSFESIGDDVRAALEAFVSKVPHLQRVIILGLCDGASAALMCCLSDRRIRGLVLLNPWVHTDAARARVLVKHYYAGRLMQRSFWSKVRAGEFDVRSSLASLLASLRRAGNPAAIDNASRSASFIDRMASAFRSFDGRTMFVLSGQDLTAREFEELTQDSPAWRNSMQRDTVRTAKILGADHTFSQHEHLEQACDLVVGWLESWPTV